MQHQPLSDSSVSPSVCLHGAAQKLPKRMVWNLSCRILSSHLKYYKNLIKKKFRNVFLIQLKPNSMISCDK